MNDEARRRNRLRHGLYTMQKAMTVLGSRALPSASTPIGQELRLWRQSLIDDLGGDQHVTTAQLAMIDLAVRSKLMVDSIDSYVLGQLKSPVNKRKNALHPVVRERQQLADGLARLLRDLGLERRRPETDVAAVLAALHGPPDPPPSPPADPGDSTDPS